MNKAKQKAEIKEALKNFKGKSGVPFSKEERFHKELKGREKERTENFGVSRKRGKLSYRK